MPDSPFPPGVRVLAYLRDSGGDEQELSIPQQESALRAWCESNRLTLTRVFPDAARPGSSAIGREGFQTMMDYCRAGGAGERAVVIWSYSRFARNLDDAQFYRAELRRLGYAVHSLHDQVPPGPDGRFFEAAIDWMNERRLEEISADVKRGLMYNLTTYGALPGTPPRGFKREQVQVGERRGGGAHIVARWAPDPELVPLVQRAFAMRAAGESYERITQATGLYRSRNSWITFFRNKLYLGILEYGSLTVPDYCEPLIDPDTWEAVRRINDRRSVYNNPHHPRRVHSAYLLSGLLYCQDCGSPMNGHSIRADHYYTCSRAVRRRDCPARKIPAAPLEQAVTDALVERALSLDNLLAIQAAMAESYHAASGWMEQERAALQTTIRAHQSRTRNLLAAIEAHGHSPAMLTRLADLEKQIDHARARLDQLDELPPPPELSAPDLRALAESLTAILQHGDLPARRALLRGMVARILARRDEARIVGLVEYTTPQLIALPNEAARGGRENIGLYAYAPTETLTIDLIIPRKKHRRKIP